MDAVPVRKVDTGEAVEACRRTRKGVCRGDAKYVASATNVLARRVEKVSDTTPYEFSWVYGIFDRVNRTTVSTPETALILQVLIAMIAVWIKRLW
jgi:hypothetical protein